jgi:hypothetical protein
LPINHILKTAPDKIIHASIKVYLILGLLFGGKCLIFGNNRPRAYRTTITQNYIETNRDEKLGVKSVYVPRLLYKVIIPEPVMPQSVNMQLVSQKDYFKATLN